MKRALAYRQLLLELISHFRRHLLLVASLALRLLLTLLLDVEKKLIQSCLQNSVSILHASETLFRLSQSLVSVSCLTLDTIDSRLSSFVDARDVSLSVASFLHVLNDSFRSLCHRSKDESIDTRDFCEFTRRSLYASSKTLDKLLKSAVDVTQAKEKHTRMQEASSCLLNLHH